MLIDCHNHSMILGGVNEATLPSTAMVRIGDVVNSETDHIHQQLAGGLTVARRTMAEIAAAVASQPKVLFLDIETTGLGGAGAMVFLVTTGRVEPCPDAPGAETRTDEFVLRQYLAPSPAEEGVLLARLVADCIGAPRPLLVTYNGRGFDWPLIEARLCCAPIA